jgi:hypothetical protein
MLSQGKTRPVADISSQKGQIIFFTIVLLGAITTYAIYGILSPLDPEAANRAITERALSEAKNALIGYAAAHFKQPGRLPCPDHDGNGLSGSCTTTVQTRIGFLPWKALGIPNLRDGSGSPLLYAVTEAYSSGALPLNSNSSGDYSVTGQESATNVIAIVFAPGPVTGAQQRDASIAPCVTRGTPISRNLCPASYLEGGNENGDTSFVAGLPAANFNDRLMLITSDKLFPVILARVLSDPKRMLNAYFAAYGYYPNPTPFGGTECNASTFQGVIPSLTTQSKCKSEGKNDWIGTFSDWFFPNGWGQLTFYAVSPECTSAATTSTCLATGGLAVSGVSNNTRALLIGTGRAYAGQLRPCAAASDCLEAAENTNGDNVFLKPSSSPSNDLLLIVAP